MSGNVSTRMKRVTDPLDDKVKARIVGRFMIEPDYVSSGSEYSAQTDDGVTSPTLSELFFDFGFNDSGDSSPETNDSDSESDPSIRNSIDVNLDLNKPIVLDQNDAFQKVLTDHVFKAVQQFSRVKSNKQILRRNVMTYLRECGYNAAICKTKWESAGGLTSGNYEFIDVVLTECSARYFIDLDFGSEFEIARPASSYQHLLQYVPEIFVGKSEDLKKILKAVSDAARQSLKSRGLILPPWRKHRYMQNKWFGPYRRTTNLYPASFTEVVPSAKESYGAVKCRAVGFDVTVTGGQLLLPASARMR